MTYAELRIRAVTGDVLAVKGTGIAGSIIRAFTGESYSHVALLVQETAGLFAYEFVEGTGYQILPASEWVRRRKKQNLRFCRAPQAVVADPDAVAAAARLYRNSSVISRWYGWLSLAKVLVSQITGLKIPVRQKVCSTFVQECWAATGYTLPTTADPGEIVNACDPVHTITTEEQ